MLDQPTIATDCYTITRFLFAGITISAFLTLVYFASSRFNPPIHEDYELLTTGLIASQFQLVGVWFAWSSASFKIRFAGLFLFVYAVVLTVVCSFEASYAAESFELKGWGEASNRRVTRFDSVFVLASIAGLLTLIPAVPLMIARRWFGWRMTTESSDSDETSEISRVRFQLSLRRLLIATAVVAGLLALLRFTSPDSSFDADFVAKEFNEWGPVLIWFPFSLTIATPCVWWVFQVSNIAIAPFVMGYLLFVLSLCYVIATCTPVATGPNSDAAWVFVVGNIQAITITPVLLVYKLTGVRLVQDQSGEKEK